jgi:hypothetical protein
MCGQRISSTANRSDLLIPGGSADNRMVGRLRSLTSSWRITPLGWIVMVVVPALILLAAFGPAVVQVPAFIVGLLILAGVAAEGLGGLGNYRFWGRSSGGDASAQVTEAAEADEYAWQRERERREQRQRAHK